jgi:hypothetical protein
MNENPEASKNYYFVVVGFLYGLMLSIIGLLVAGAGHGTYALIGAFSAPFGLLGIPVALLGAIILWSVLGLVLAASKMKILLFLMGIHYVGIILVLNTETYGDTEYFSKMFETNPSLIILGLVVYVVGQLLIWLRYLMIKTSLEM